MDIQYPDLHPFYKDIFDKAVSDSHTAKEIEFICGFFEEWVGNFLHPVGDDLFHSKKLDSIVLYCYLASQSFTFDWMAHSLLLGHYETVLRELRSILENAFLMFYLDCHYDSKTILEKFTMVEQMENENRIPYGKRVFKDSEYPDWEYCYKLYGEMSKYVHASTKTNGLSILKIATKGFPETLDIQYSQDSFLKCVEMWQRVSIIVLSLVKSLFEKANIEVKQFNPGYLASVWKISTDLP